jgi:hypothetical protein
MAVTLESGTLVWKRVEQFFAMQRSAGSTNPAIVGEFLKLRDWFVQQQGNPQLQFIPFADADLVQATGFTPVAAACKVYAVYFIKNGTNGVGTTTAMWLTLANEATNTTLALNLILLHTAIASQQMSAIYPAGKSYGTDLTITAQDASLNGTEVAGGAAGSGFVIIGAA